VVVREMGYPHDEKMARELQSKGLYDQVILQHHTLTSFAVSRNHAFALSAFVMVS
jgi:hypothetical protein